MHFYTYDEWLNNSYYSKDNKEIEKGDTKVLDITDAIDNGQYLTIRSCWRNPTFVSTYSGVPSIVPDMNVIDCDVGCLYQMKSSVTYPDNTKSGYRKNRGCIQELGNKYGDIANFPYVELASVSSQQPYHIYDKFSGLHKEIISINLSEWNQFDRLLIFQSIYSGAISFEEMSSSLEFLLSDYLPTSSGYDYKNYDFKMNTNLYSSSSLMIVGALITFDQMNLHTFAWIQNISKFVYGHVDMDQLYEWGNVWRSFRPPISASVLPDSIMHFTKEVVVS